MSRSVSRFGLAVLFAIVAASLLVAYVGQETAKWFVLLGPWRVSIYPLGHESARAPALSTLFFVLTLVWWLRRDPRPWRGSPHLAMVCSASLLLLCVVSAVRTARHQPVDEFPQRLIEVTQTIPLSGVEQHEQHEYLPWIRIPVPARGFKTYGPGPLGPRQIKLDGLSVIQKCEKEGCKTRLVSDPEEFWGGFHDDERMWSAALRDAPLQDWGESIRIARDPEEPIFYVLGLGSKIEYRLDGVEYRASELDQARIVAKASPPRSWLGFGLFGLALIGVLFAVRRSRARKGTSHLDAAQPGTLGEDGFVTLADERRIRTDSSLNASSGPVLVLRPSPGTVYREDTVLRPEDILPGTLEEHLSRHRNNLLRIDAVCATCATLFAAPLAGAAAAGLVF